MEHALVLATFKYYKLGSYLIRIEDRPNDKQEYRGIDNHGMPIVIDKEGLTGFNEVKERTFYNNARF